MLTLLRHPVFARLFAAQLVALLGTGLLTVALGLLAYDLAGADASVVLGTAYAIKMLAYVGLSPLAAALLARVPRKVVLIVADAVRGAVALSLPFLGEVWQIYVAIFVLQAASASFTPVFQAVIPEVLPDEEDYTRALSLSRLAYDLESLASPLVAAALLWVISFHWLFVGTAAGFAISGAIIAVLALPRAAQVRRPFRERLTRGTAIYLATPRLRGLLAVTLTAAATSAFVITNTVTLVRDGYAGTEGDVALALAAYGAGSMILALALPRILAQRSDRSVMLMAAAALTALIVGYAVTSVIWAPPSWAVFLLLWAGLGAGFAAAVTPGGRLITRSTRNEDRAAVFTAQFALSHAMWLITYPVAGYGLAWLGLAPSLIVMALFCAAGLILAHMLWPRGTSDPIAHDHPDLPPDHPHLVGHGAHRHPIIIDDMHRHWPTQG